MRCQDVLLILNKERREKIITMIDLMTSAISHQSQSTMGAQNACRMMIKTYQDERANMTVGEDYEEFSWNIMHM